MSSVAPILVVKFSSSYLFFFLFFFFFRWIFQRIRPSYFSIFFESLWQTQTDLPARVRTLEHKMPPSGCVFGTGRPIRRSRLCFSEPNCGRKTKKHLKTIVHERTRKKQSTAANTSTQGFFFFFFFQPRRVFPVERRCSGVSVSPVLLCFRSCILSQSCSCGMPAYTQTNSVSGNWWEEEEEEQSDWPSAQWPLARFLFVRLNECDSASCVPFSTPLDI